MKLISLEDLKYAYIPNIIGGIALGVAWQIPGTVLSALLSFVSAILLALPFIKGNNSYTASFLFGALAHTIANNWIVGTISDFGGYETNLAILIFVGYVTVHASAFMVFVFFERILRKTFLANLRVTLPLSWIAANTVSGGIFPWDFAHNLLAIRPLIQIADIGGTILITTIIFLAVQLICDVIRRETSRKFNIIIAIIISATVLYGIVSEQIYKKTATTHTLALVQGNLKIHEKNNIRYLIPNVDRYIRLSKKVVEQINPDLIVWPESIINNPAREPLTGKKVESFFAELSDSHGMLVGSLTDNMYGDLFNSAIGINPPGIINGVYHKQILMPFGEYMPLADRFPILNMFNPNITNFKAGSSVEVFNYENGIKAAPLICYEDLLPDLSLNASRQGANILINLTNDAWFGKSAAATQHNMIAAFRAIETRRFLVRATNTGLSTIISPTGQILAQSPVFEESFISAPVYLNENLTFYTRIGGNTLWRILAYVIIIFALTKWLLKWKRK